MSKNAFILLVPLLAVASHAQVPNELPNNYLVLNGRSHHFSPAPKVMQLWNESNTGLSYQRSYPTAPYRYSAEIGAFKDSFGQFSAYGAGAALRDVHDYPRVSVGGMLGIAYRTNQVSTAYVWDPNVGWRTYPKYGSKELTPIGGLVLQVALPSTPIVIQTTWIPKAHQRSSAIVFGQMMIRF